MTDHATPGDRPLAAIDVGTNSVHMVVARATPLGPLEVIARDRVKVRLGSGEGDMKTLAPDAVDRAIEAIDRFARIAEAHDAEVVAVATSAVRESENTGEFLRKVLDETGVRVDVIAGVEEARLIHLGAISAVEVGQTNHLVIDIGGGSTEIVIGSKRYPLLTRSLKLGHIRLTDGFFPGGEIAKGSVKRLRTHLKSFLAEVAKESRALGHEVAIGCSGTIETVATISARMEGHAVRTVDNLVLTREGLDDVVDELIARPQAVDRVGLDGLDDARVDVIPAGALLLQQLFRALAIEEMVISPNALREGVVLDRLNRRAGTPDALHHLGDLRRQSVLAVAERYEEDVAHAKHATDLALELFDETVSLHGLQERHRLLLEAAGMLHNVGRFIAHAAHHKHSYYLIRHSEQLLGFTEQELELVALIARYHRKSAPRSRHSEFAALSAEDQGAVRVLAGLLRVGIGLDRSYQRVVERVEAEIGDERVDVRLHLKAGVDASLEVFTAGERSDLLASSLEREVALVAALDPVEQR